MSHPPPPWVPGRVARPGVPVRIYVHEAISTLVTGAQLSSPRMTRHDAVLMIALSDQGFTVHADGITVSSRSMVIAPNVRHAVDATGCRLVRMAVHIIHPRFAAVRAALSKPVTDWPREAFACFDERLQQAYEGVLDATQAGWLMDEMIDLLLADAQPTQQLDWRVLWALKKLEADIDHPFDDLAGQLGLSQSRLSHLFTEHLGISLRGCQAWGRMAMAWELLTWKRPDLSLTEVAHMMRFSDSSHLSRALKRRYGMTPTMFRDQRIVDIVHTPVGDGSRIPPMLSAE